MRIAIIATESTPLAAALADRLNIPLLDRVDEILADEFVLDGAPADVAQARALDAALRRRAADLDAVLWVREPHPSAEVDAVLDHYRGRVVEIDPQSDTLEAALDGLRETLIAA